MAITPPKLSLFLLIFLNLLERFPSSPISFGDSPNNFLLANLSSLSEQYFQDHLARSPCSPRQLGKSPRLLFSCKLPFPLSQFFRNFGRTRVPLCDTPNPLGVSPSPLGETQPQFSHFFPFKLNFLIFQLSVPYYILAYQILMYAMP